MTAPRPGLVARNEEYPAYAPTAAAPDTDAAGDEVIRRALVVLQARLRNPGAAMDSPHAVKDLLRLRMGMLEREEFVVLFLDAQHRVITTETMFVGTLMQTSVYPREVVKAALSFNAAAVILAHNHPSGVAEPSRADEHLTMALKSALALIDVRVLDHMIVGGMAVVSFAERGLL